MSVIAGIDEAGYGPILGPLVVAASALRVPVPLEEAETYDAWAALAPEVGRDPPRGRRKPHEPLLIGDSKVLFQQGRGLARLERAVLAALALAHGDPLPTAQGVEDATAAPDTAGDETDLPLFAAARAAARAASGRASAAPLTSGFPAGPVTPGTAPATLRELLARLGVPPGLLEATPWGSGHDRSLPSAAPADSIDSATSGLAAAAPRAGVTVLPPAARVLDPGPFNAAVDRIGNKHLVEWEVVAGLLTGLFERDGRLGISVTVDRLSGRKRYDDLLRAAFPRATVRGRARPDAEPAYEVHEGGRRMWIAFLEKGDRRSLPTALASMIAKLLRELLMAPLNAYFAERIPGLLPTAGYYEDGMRFLADIELLLPALDRDTLIRRV